MSRLTRVLSLILGCLLAAGGSALALTLTATPAPAPAPVVPGVGADFTYDPSPYEKDPEEPRDPVATPPLPPGTIAYRVDNPAAGYIEGEETQDLRTGGVSSPVTACARIGYRFTMWSDGVREATRAGDSSEAGDLSSAGRSLTALFDYIGLPEVRLSYSELGLNKEDYLPGSISVGNLPPRYEMTDTPLRLRGRGNSSFRFEKKSLKLKFGEKVDFLGLGGGTPAKTWVLIANYTDKSLLRNYFAYCLQQKLRLGYSFSCVPVTVFVNDDYRGVYLACPQIEAGDGRVPINDAGGGDDIGFLLEMDHYAEGVEGRDYFLIGQEEIPFSVKSNLRTDGQAATLEDYLSRCDAAIRAGDRAAMEELIDLPSFVDAYLLEEYVKNGDVGWSSFYLFIPEGGGKLTFGPCWDFDLSAGNDDRADHGDYRLLFAGERRGVAQENLWFSSAMSYDWFREMAAARYREILPTIRETILEVEDFASLHFTALEANFDAWHILSRKVYKEPNDLLLRGSYEGQLRYLFDWYKARAQWLDTYFSGDAASG